MYHEVQRLIREELSFTAIGKTLVIDRWTVKRYSRMSESDYASFVESKEIRDKLLTPYESLAHDKLTAHPAAQRSAMLYSLFATCKLHYVNPIQWLTYVFEKHQRP